MNRDTHTDTLDKRMQDGASAKTCSQLRQSEDRWKESTMHAETNKGVNTTPYDDFSYLLRARDPPEGFGRNTGSDSKSITLRSSSTANLRSLPSNGDLRRNLYVLGLPFDFTRSEFAKIFEPYGTVTHAVILATLDGASRRRGFIVMTTHQEAKAAMNALSRTQIKGHMLDVSWAVVQRSQGFLDGADRSMMLAVSSPPSMSERDERFAILDGSDGRWELTHVPTSKLMVSNLSTMLFMQVSDLNPLFYPFGPIKDIKILGSPHASTLNTTITAMVEYVDVSNAQEAKEALQCQLYAGHPIETQYICDASSMAHKRPSPFLAGSLFGHGKSSDIGLNPFAIPFNVGSRFSIGSQIYNPRHNPAIPSGLPSDAPFAPQPLPAHMRSYATDSISRSSSATSSTWSHDSRPLRPSRTSHSSLNRANTYTSFA